MSGVAVAPSAVVIGAVKVFNIVVTLIEMKVEVFAAVGAFQQTGEDAALGVFHGGLFTGAAHLLHLFPSSPVNDRLVNTPKDSTVFLAVFNTLFMLVAFGIGLKVDDIAAVFLQRDNFLDG